jgi:YHS domain-containing protein
MLIRLILFIILFTLIARVFWRVVDNIIEGAGGQPRRHRRSQRTTPDRPVQMVRDPVCGTFVLPERAITLADGRGSVYFCSNACRDKYRARTA